MVLFIQDGSEIIYDSHKCTYGLGPAADAFGQGIIFHACLAVESRNASEVLGIAEQMVWIRPEYNEEKAKKEQEDKESQVWLTTLREIAFNFYLTL